jgi:hypothetical protein
MSLFKDESLDHLAAYGNVAQFASFDPALSPRYSRITGHLANERLDIDAAAQTLLAASPERKINVRSFRPDNHQGNEFVYGLGNARTAVEHVRRLSGLGLYVILNETVDVNDGGVSGVSQGGVIEFAPRGTPRVVDTARPVSVRLSTGLRVLEAVYGFQPDLAFPPQYRIEFSVHPVRRGWRRGHTILWELEELNYGLLRPNPSWPNDFSEFIGDKVFGLLVASGEGYSVPRTTVLSRNLPPFSFGCPTETNLYWVRTAPRLATPGRFTTVRGWTDPFKLLAAEDPEGREISSVLVQEEVPAIYSGALITAADGEPIIEGVPGHGDLLMLGNKAPEELPEALRQMLRSVHSRIRDEFGSIRVEWVFDGEQVWVLQFQQEAPKSSGSIIVAGDFSKEVPFRVEAGLEQLRILVQSLSGTDRAVRLVGNVGVTSHMADILRRANVPSRLIKG